jgi:hypothetical protein
MWNVDFSKVCKSFTLKRINELELAMLELMHVSCTNDSLDATILRRQSFDDIVAYRALLPKLPIVAPKAACLATAYLLPICCISRFVSS